MAKTTYVVATDLSADSRKAAEVAARLATRTRATLDFFCAVPAGVVDEFGVDVERAREAVAALAKRHAEDVETTSHVAVVRDVPAAILRRAEKSRAALLVLAPHGVTGWKRLALGSVTERVLRHATVPVLVARRIDAGVKHVLVGVDRGAFARTTLRNAVALARILGAKLTAIHVVRPAELLLPLVAPVGRSFRVGDERLAAKARELAEWVGAVPDRGVDVKARVVEGSPPEMLVGEAQRLDADVVVVGSGDGGRVRRALLGSVAYAVAATCPKSVLVVRRRVAP